MSRDSPQRFWNDRIGGDPDLSSIGCAGFGLNYNRWLYRIRAHRFRQIAGGLPLDFSQARVLDIGSGTGFYLNAWRTLGVMAPEGLDFARSAVNFLGQRFPGLTVHHADIGAPDLALPEQAYDVISAFDVFFHIVADERYATALRNVSGLLKPGGFLLFSENFTHHEHPRGGDYHYSRTLENISRVIESSGLVMEYRRPMFVLMNAPDDSISRWNRLRWLLTRRVATANEKAGWFAGMVQYPLERILTSVLHESPTTEIAVCRRAQW